MRKRILIGCTLLLLLGILACLQSPPPLPTPILPPSPTPQHTPTPTPRQHVLNADTDGYFYNPSTGHTMVIRSYSSLDCYKVAFWNTQGDHGDFDCVGLQKTLLINQGAATARIGHYGELTVTVPFPWELQQIKEIELPAQ